MDGKRPHAGEMFLDRGRIALVETEDDLRVTTRPEAHSVPFETRTRSLTLAGPTLDEQVVASAAVELLSRLDETRAVRLVGVRLEMAPPDD